MYRISTRIHKATQRQKRAAFILTVLVMTIALSVACLLPVFNRQMTTAFGYGAGSSKFYFPWYDSAGGKTWVMAAQPYRNVNDNIEIFSGSFNLTGGYSIQVPQGQTVPIFFNDFLGGPIRVSSQDPYLMVSERSLFGNSFEEVWATPYDKLESHYYWPWYDNVNMKNWVMVANPLENYQDVWAQVKVKGGHQAVKKLAPGEAWTPEFPGVMNGPVEVKAWRDGGSEYSSNDARKVIASQRVLWNGAFNEIPGIGVSGLDSWYHWTWYDNASPGAANWVSVSNPDFSSPVFVLIVVGDIDNPVFIDYAWIGPYETRNFRNDGIGGPVTLAASYDPGLYSQAPVVATQRVLWGPSFSEIAGTNTNSISTWYHWTWYDMKSPGVSNWIVLTNLDDEPINYKVKVRDQVLASGQIGIDGAAYPTIPGYIGGPVEVTGDGAWTNQPAFFLASQRVVWNGYFNEVVGKP